MPNGDSLGERADVFANPYLFNALGVPALAVLSLALLGLSLGIRLQQLEKAAGLLLGMARTLGFMASGVFAVWFVSIARQIDWCTGGAWRYAVLVPFVYALFCALCLAVGVIAQLVETGGFDRLACQPQLIKSVYALTVAVALLASITATG